MQEPSIEEQLELPLVQSLLRENEELLNKAKSPSHLNRSFEEIKGVKVFKLENELLMQAGHFNGVEYPEEELKKVIPDLNGSHLVLDHQDTKDRGAETWVGEVQNARWESAGPKGPGIYGDLLVVDSGCAQKLKFGAKWGLSPTWNYDNVGTEEEPIAANLSAPSFSFVLSPAVRDTMLNSLKNKEGDIMPEEDLVKKKKKYPYPYPEPRKEDKYPGKRGQKIRQLDVDEEVLDLLQEKDAQIRELQEFKNKVELQVKKEKVSQLLATEFLLERFNSEDELSSRQKELEEMEISQIDVLIDYNGLPEELSAYTAFVKKYMKEHKGATIAEAAKAWKKLKGTSKQSMTDLPAVSEPLIDQPKSELASASNSDKLMAELLERQYRGGAK